MARGTGELFHQCAALFCLQAERLIDGTLSDKEKTVLRKAGSIKEFVEIA